MNRIRAEKTEEIVTGSARIGESYYFGAAFAEKEICLVLLEPDAKTVRDRVSLDSTYKTGDYFHCRISGADLDHCFYYYEVAGRPVPDPCSKTMTGCTVFGKAEEKAVYASRVVLHPFDWQGDQPLQIPFSECIFYKLHVRGFTKSHTSRVPQKGTFEGVAEKIPYLQELGVTSIELMPAYEFDEAGRFPQLAGQMTGPFDPGIGARKINYWGYIPGYYFAPKAAYAWKCSDTDQGSDAADSFRSMVLKLHQAGLEVIMEMCFTQESTGFILSCLRYWVSVYHIDGIHLYAGRDAIHAAAEDPFLAHTKLLTDYWDGPAAANRHIASCNGEFARMARQFLKGDENQLGAFAAAVRNNPPQNAVLNYITSHNGFTLQDLVSYDRKHNEANGEDNRDGENFNYSWNCGEEGETRKKKILALRKKQMKNAWMMLLLSEGTPLLLAGDEFHNSQNGNNNPYCQDNELSWVTWKQDALARQMFAFVQGLIRFRKNHPVLHTEKQLLASDSLSCGYPDISYHGSSAWYAQMEPYNRHIGVMFCSRYALHDSDELIYIAYNMHWEPHELALPNASEECRWQMLLCTDDSPENAISDNRVVRIQPRSAAVLVGTIKTKKESSHDGKRKHSQGSVRRKNADQPSGGTTEKRNPGQGK